MGGDSVEILREIGYSTEEIDELVRSRVTIDGRDSNGNKRDANKTHGNKRKEA